MSRRTYHQNGKIWYEDLRGAFADDRFLRVLPDSNMALEEQLNAVFRFCVYFSAIMLALRRNLLGVYVAFGGALLTYWMYETRAEESKAKRAMFEGLHLGPTRDGKYCVRPTLDNPFMNVSFTDRKDFPERPKACTLLDSAVRKKAESCFSRNLYQDVDDVFGRNANSRNFYTMPVTTLVNDQTEFAKWLYRPNEQTCKEGSGEVCVHNLHEFVRRHPSQS